MIKSLQYSARGNKNITVSVNVVIPIERMTSSTLLDPCIVCMVGGRFRKPFPFCISQGDFAKNTTNYAQL